MSTPQPIAWQGRVYRHIPVGSPYPLLDQHLAARSRENRWNQAGDPTMAFASSPDLLVAELADHVRRNRDVELAAWYKERCIVAVELSLERVFDLTDPAGLDILGIGDAPGGFADRGVARAVAGFLRHARKAQAVRVPSLLAPVDPANWLLVVFLDQLPAQLEEVVTLVEPGETFQLPPIVAP